MFIFPNFVPFLKDEYMDGCANGRWEDQKGKSHQFFTCEEGKGLYFPINHLTRHERVSRQIQLNCKYISYVPCNSIIIAN